MPVDSQHFSEPSTTSTDGDSSKPPVRDTLLFASILFAFWLVLSGKLDVFHVLAGAFASVVIALATNGLYAAEPPIGPRGRHPIATIPWLRLMAYIPWLVWQIVTASIQVAQIVLSPNMPIVPRMTRFRAELPDNLARATLANSITLTPGTVTIDVTGDEYLVHALTDDSAEDLQRSGPSSMQARVQRVFSRKGE